MVETVGMVFDRIEAQQALALTVGPEANSLDFLQMIYRNNSLPLPTRMRAAIYCLPFETPKLLATSIVSEGSFAEILDRRLARMKEKKLIEARPVNGEPTNSEPMPKREPEPAPTLPSPLNRLYSPRFRRRF